MCEVGRIKHHLKHNLYRPESTILFVGFQAEGTLGKRILSGERIVKIFGEEIAVNARIEYIEGYSGHADQEYSGQQALKASIEEEFGIKTIIPDFEETYTADGKLLEGVMPKYQSTRFDILEMLSYLKQDVDDVSNTVKAEIKNNPDENDLLKILRKLEEVKAALVNVREK